MAKKCGKLLRRAFACLLVVVMTLTAVPFSGIGTFLSTKANAWQTLYWPVLDTTTSQWTTYDGHGGAIDIAGGQGGKTIIAACSGTVVKVSRCTIEGSHNGYQCQEGGYTGSSGNYNPNCWNAGTGVWIQGDDGRYYVYAHMQPGSNSHISYGQRITGGQVLGKVGKTGYATGYHLHFAITAKLGASSGYNAAPGSENYVYYNQTVTHYLDVNTYVDGAEYKGGYAGVTFDVRLNGTTVATGVQDYYTPHNQGTNWAVTHINIPNQYVLTGALTSYGDFAGTLNSATAVNLTLTTPTLVSTKYFQGRKYELYHVSTPWYYADLFAKAKGGHLATITSAQEQSFISSNFADENCWLGGFKNSSGSWEWVTGEPFSYTYWASGEPNNSKELCADGETRLGILSNMWNDYWYYATTLTGFIVEYNHEHTWNTGKVTVASTCAAPGKKVYTCTTCKQTKTTTISPLGHKYVSQKVAATCMNAEGTKYTCSVCNNSYIKPSKYTSWSVKKPEGVPNDKIETQTQYCYSDYETKTSVDSSMSGYTLIKSEWKPTSSGTVRYVSSWPSDFNRNNSLYAKYNITPKATGETATKRITATTTNGGYLYWHWCRGQYFGSGPINRLISDCYTNEFWCFHCFESSAEGSNYDPNGAHSTSFYYPNASCCSDTYWYLKVPVSQQNWKEETKYYTFGRWTDYSDWSSTPVCETSTRRVKTRTLYRTELLGEHTYKTTKTKATTAKDGKTGTACTTCGKVTKSVVIPKVSSFNLSATAYSYDGKTKTPTVTVKDSKGKTLKNSTDYTLAYSSGRKDIGRYAVKVTLKGNYSGTKTLYFDIKPAQVSKPKATQTTSSVTLSWSKVAGSNMRYYVFSYNPSTKKYTCLGYTTGTSYTVKKLSSGTTYYYAVQAYNTTAKKWGKVSSVLTTATKPGTPTLKAVAGTRKATLSWNKQTGATGYVLYMATSKTGKYTKIATLKVNTKVSYTKTGLTKGKTYYFKVIAYKTVGSTNVYGAYSSVKYVKVK